MLFVEKYEQSKEYDQYDFDNTKILYSPSRYKCAFCQKEETNFVDVKFQLPVCSEECDRQIWVEYNKEMGDNAVRSHMQRYEKEIKQELVYLEDVNNVMKDIIVVVHDQLDYLKTTVDSLLKYTENFHLWIWDNNSNQETQDYLHELMFQLNQGDDSRGCTVMRSDANLGFIEPNNELAAMGTGDYIILLNSDVKVSGGWDKAMLGWLQHNQDTKIVGYGGGLLDSEGVGGRAAFGYEIDYVTGWCLCMNRDTYDEYGLFNSELKFAYAEDSELSIRLQSQGHRIYALHLMLVHHFENKTINQVRDENTIDVVSTFSHNHEKLRELWGDYLNNQRIDVRKREKGQDAFDDIFRNF